MEVSPTNFWTRFYSVVQPFLGGWTLLLPRLPAKFWIMAGEGGNFFEKKQNKSCCFQNVFNFLAADFSLAAGIFYFFRQFSVCFQVFHFNRKKEHLVGRPSFLIGWLSNIRRLLTFAENAVKRYALCRKMKIVIRNLIYSVSGFLLLCGSQRNGRRN